MLIVLLHASTPAGCKMGVEQGSGQQGIPWAPCGSEWLHCLWCVQTQWTSSVPNCMPGHSWLVCGRPKGLLLTVIFRDNKMTHAVGFLSPVLSVPFPMVTVDQGKRSSLPCVLEARLLPLLSLYQEMGKHVCTLNKDV